MSATNSQEQSLLEAALRLESESERNTFLDAACANDPGLRRRLDELMHVYEQGLLRKAQALRVAVQRGLREPLQP